MCVADGLFMRGGLSFSGGRGQTALKERLDNKRGDPRQQQPEHPLQQGELARAVAAQQVDLRFEARLGLLQSVPQVGVMGAQVGLGDRSGSDLHRPERLGNSLCLIFRHGLASLIIRSWVSGIED
jgi:hypothetical protein